MNEAETPLLLRFLSDDKGSDTLENVAIVAFVVLPLWYVLTSKKATYYQGMWGLWQQLVSLANPGP